MLLQKVGPKLQNATRRLCYCKEVYQTIFLGHFFTQDRRPIGRPLAPSPLTLRGDKSLRDCDVRYLRSSKNLSGYAPLKWSRSNSRDAKIFAEPNSKLGEANDCKLDNIRRVFRKQRNEKWQNIWGMSAANFALKNSHTHSKILGNQNAIPQKILT